VTPKVKEVLFLYMDNKLEIQEFFVEGSDQQASHVLLHIAEPVTEEEKERGYFFALVEVTNNHPEQITQLQEIIDTIESQYYETNDFTENTFEHILQDINKQSHHVLNYPNSVVHSIVGILQNRRLVLAYHGSPKAILYYASHEEIKETSIIEESADTHTQLFSAVVEGVINAGDYVYIATPHVDDYFSSDRVRKILQNRTTRQSTAHITKVLESLSNKYSFGGVLFHIPKTIPRDTPLYKKESVDIGSQASMNNFLNTARTTEETLSPPLLKHVREGTQNFLSRLKQHGSSRAQKAEKRNKDTTKKIRHGAVETNYRPSEGQPQEKLTEKILIMVGRSIVVIATGFYFVAKKIILWMGAILVHLFFLITNRNGQRSLIIDKTRSYVRTKQEQIENMGMVSRVLFIALIVFAVILAGSIIYIKIKENREAKQIQYTNLVQNIEEKTHEAEAHILYGEEDKALSILQEARRLADTLPQKEEEDQNQARTLYDTIDGLLIKLRKITMVDTEMLADLTQTNPQAHALYLAYLDDKIIAFGPDDDFLYSVDPITKQLDTISHDTIKHIGRADVPKENDKIVFIKDTNSIVEYNKETRALSVKDISYDADNPSITDLAIYNQRIYTLSKDRDQIYKHNPTQTGYDRGTPWISSKTNSLASAVALAVDGDIYVLNADGTIFKFYASTEQTFSITGLDPVLQNPINIWTYADTDSIYIAEPTNKRVVIIDKDGNFVSQYTNDAWNNISDMVVSEEDKSIFVLSDNKIYTFNY